MKKAKKITLYIFLVILVIPNILMVFNINDYFKVGENRNLRKFSNINIKNPIQAIKTFKYAYMDNFGLKNISFSIYSFIKSEFLNESALPNKTIKGKNGWYFLGNSEGNVLNNSVGLNKINNKEWIIANQNIDNLFNKMNNLGVPFYFLLTRHKHEIYSEYLPFKIKNQRSKFDTIIDYWIKKYPIIDLKNCILDNKKNGQLYHKTDTHWNELGAYYGFNELIGNLKPKFPDLNKINIEDYTIVSKKVDQLDLTAMLNKKLEENIFLLEKKEKSPIIASEYIYPKAVSNQFINPNKKYKVIIFRDSFSLAMMKFYKETFKQCIFIKSRIPDIDLIKKEKPDLVILQFTSRRIELEGISSKRVYFH